MTEAEAGSSTTPDLLRLAARRAFEQAVGLMQANAFAEAGAMLDAALQESPNDPNLLRLLGVSLSKQNRSAEAEKVLTHVVRIVPNFGLAHENLADALVSQGKIEEAVQSLNTAIRHNPASAGANRKLGELLARTGRGGEADDLFRQSLEADPDRGAIVEAMELNRRGETAKAKKSIGSCCGATRRTPMHCA